jgi:AcrR family transcriptional regulator
MSIPYDATGRVSQKARTRNEIVSAAIDLINNGERATIEAAAARAGVGRGTAYRYFPNERSLLAAAHPEVDASSLLGPDAPSDPLERLRIVAAEIANITVTTEPALRAMLRLSLQEGGSAHDLPLRKGRRIIWVADALAPLQPSMADADFHALTVGIASAIGIEAYIWLRDIARLSPEQAARTLCWTATTLFIGSRQTGGPVL